MLSKPDERFLTLVAAAAGEPKGPGVYRRIGRVAGLVCERGGAVVELARRCAADDLEAWRLVHGVLDRHHLALAWMDLVCEVSQLDRVASDEPRAWNWPYQREAVH